MLGEISLPPVATTILQRLEQDLSKDLLYHDVEHTESVICEVYELATIDELTEREIELLLIAAAYHDSGFLVQRKSNEFIGARFARAALEESQEYSEEEIEEVELSILSTELQVDLRRIPKTSLSKYLLDADVANLGKEDFFEKTALLIQENKVEAVPFLIETLELMDKHEWLTPAAEEKYAEGKRKNYDLLLQKVKSQKK